MSQQHAIVPNSNISNPGGWSPSDFSNIDDPYGSPDFSNSIAKTGIGALGLVATYGASNMVPAHSIQGIHLYWAADTSLSTIVCDIGFGPAGDYIAVSSTGTTGLRSGHVFVANNPITGLPFTIAELDAAIFRVSTEDSAAGGGQTVIYHATIVVDYVAAPRHLGYTRFLASAVLNLSREILRIVEVRAPLYYATLPFNTEFDITHRAIPSTEATGGREVWHRYKLVKVGERDDPNNPAAGIILTCLLVRDLQVGEWDTMESQETPNSFDSGVARLDAGAGRTFARASKLYVENPETAVVGIKQVIELAPNVEGLTVGGTLLEAAGNNYVLNPCFISGVTAGPALANWTLTGVPTNNVADLLFETRITPRALNVPAAGAIEQGAMVLTGIQVACFSVDYIGAGRWWARRTSDNWYWNDTTQAFQSGEPTNGLPVVAGSSRFVSNPVNFGSAGLTAIVKVVNDSSSNLVVQHVQLEPEAYATSRMIGTRSAADLRVPNNFGKRVFQGHPDYSVSWFFDVITEWDSNDLAAGSRVIDRIQFNTANFVRVFYNFATGAFSLRSGVAGVNMNATISKTVVRGTRMCFGCRIIGRHGEYGISPGTVSIFLDGLKGADAASSLYGGLPSFGTRFIGQDHDQTAHADATISRRRTYFEAFSDDEMIGRTTQ